MEINFCDKCDNLMYLYSNEENNALYLGCKVCGRKKDFIENKCIYSSEFNMDLSETMNQNEYLANDNTLPNIQGNQNIKCPNQECISIKEEKPSNVMYIKYDQENLKFMYICKYCNQKWTNQ